MIRNFLAAALLLSSPLFSQTAGGAPVVISELSEAADKAINAAALEARYPGQKAVYLERITEYVNVVKTMSSSGFSWALRYRE
jgi:hypothetical protein